MAGFYRLQRGWMDSAVFGSPARHPFCRRAAWTWLVEDAAYGPRTVRVGGGDIELGRGQILRTLQHLGGAWGWDTMKVARFISLIQRSSLIDTLTVKGRQVITICNYDQFCAPSIITDTATETTVEPQWSATVTGSKEVNNNLSSNEDRLLPAHAREGSRPASAREIAESMLAIWREECGDALGNPAKAADSRIKKCSARLRGSLEGDIENWRELCRRIRRSWYLTEKWKASIDWVLEPRNMLKIQEGNYDNKPSRSGSPVAELPLPDPAEQWRVRLSVWTNEARGGPVRERWREVAWGPPPGEPGCLVPPRILAEFGLGVRHAAE